MNLKHTGFLDALSVLLGCASLIIASIFSGNSSTVLILSSVTGLATVIGCIHRGQSMDRAILTLLLVLTYAYFIRYLVVRTNPELLYFLVPPIAWPAIESEATGGAALAYTSFFFISFCTSLTLIGLTYSQRTYAASTRRSPWLPELPRPPVLLLLVALITLAAVNTTMLSRGIGQQGTFVGEPLPLKLTGVVVYIKSVVVPCLFVLYIYLAERESKYRLSRSATVLLLSSGALDMFLFSSRGALLNQILFLGIVWIISGFKLRKTDYVALTLFIIAALFLVPIITTLRLYDSELESFSLSQILSGITFVLFRITGFDQLAIIVNLANPLSLNAAMEVLTSERGVPGYYSSEILGYSADIPQTFAPSGLGWLYITGGTTGLVVGSILLAGLLTYGWRMLNWLLPRFATVAQGYFLFQLIMIVTEGSFGPSFTALGVGITTLWFAERLLKAHNRRKRGRLSNLNRLEGST